MADARDSISIAVWATEELDAEVRAAVIELCIAAHKTEAFREMFDHFPSGRHFIGYRESELVAHAVVTTRWLQSGEQPRLRTAYVDAVSTLPKYQGLGYGSAVMRRLASEIEDYEIACLQTDEPGFYARLGWEVWRGPLAGRRHDELIPTPDQRGVMVLRLPQTPPIDFDTPLSIECQSYRIWE